MAVVVLALTPGTQSGTVPLEHPPVFTAVRGLTLSPHAKPLSVAVAGAEAIQMVALTSQRAVRESRVGCSPQQIVALPNGTKGLVVNRGPGSLAGFDSRCYTVSQTIRVDTTPHGLAGSSVARTASGAHEGSQDVSVVGGASSTVTATSMEATLRV
jgi:hypothetical protein